MNLTWNLDELYTSLGDCRASNKELSFLIEKIKRWQGLTIDKDNLKSILDE